MTLADQVRALQQNRDPDAWEVAVEAILLALAEAHDARREAEDLV